MKHHEIEKRVNEVTNLPVFVENDGVSVTVTGDMPEMVSLVRQNLNDAGFSFTESRHRKFKGATFIVAIRNVGTAFNADWEFC